MEIVKPVAPLGLNAFEHLLCPFLESCTTKHKNKVKEIYW